MNINKRDFIKLSGAAALVTAGCSSGTEDQLAVQVPADQAEAPAALKDITTGAVPIGVDERLARIAKAQKLMVEHDIAAILLEPGSAMLYFSGVSWWRSERLTTVVIPREGEIGVVTPFFEEPSVRESMTFGDDVRSWHEHESPFERVAGILRDRNITSGRIGLEDSVRHFVADGLKKVAPEYEIVSGRAVVNGCRMIKSPVEIELMRKANEVTLTAYSYVHENLELGMESADIISMMMNAQAELGGDGGGGLALLGVASAYPHGTNQPQKIEEGKIVLLDFGTSVQGYSSDISRTFVFGEPNKRQREVWDTMRKGQDIAFEAAQVGATAGSVDDAVRSYYETLGWGPGYMVPGLSHRTGHGIGMDGHEMVNFVHGEDTLLAPGMCFSNEPGLYDFDSFGVRLEDCLYMTEDGPAWFTVPPDSLDDPIGRMG